MAWIPREDDIDRFYVRMDTKDFSFEQTIDKINRAIKPHHLSFKKIVWFSQFSVKESVAEKFFVQDRIFLTGDACHIHSVNGGQGLNTGLADAFNLMWKLNKVMNWSAPVALLQNYEEERKPVAQSVIDASGELVRATKYSASGTHAQDYVKIVQKRAGNITGMGICYGDGGLRGSRLFDFEIFNCVIKTRLYSLLDYTKFSLLIFSDCEVELKLPQFVKVIQISSNKHKTGYWTNSLHYINQAVLVRPDSYIESSVSLDKVASLIKNLQYEDTNSSINSL